jgi:hypothetical protein
MESCDALKSDAKSSSLSKRFQISLIQSTGSAGIQEVMMFDFKQLRLGNDRSSLFSNFSTASSHFCRHLLCSHIE